MAALIIFGGIAFMGLGISEKPDVDDPVVSIKIDWPGASARNVELDIIDLVESSVLGIEGIEELESTAKRGSASIVVYFKSDKNIDLAVQEVQSVIGRVQRRLPLDIDPPQVYKSNPEDRPILWLSITSKEVETKELMKFVRDKIKDRFQAVSGVSEVILGGYVDPNLRIWADPKKMDQYELTAQDIVGTVAREHLELPGGLFEKDDLEYTIRVLGEGNFKEFSNLPIISRGGRPNFSPIPLSKLARIEDGLEDIHRMSRVNGSPSIGIGIRKQRGTNSVAVADNVKELMEEIKLSLPKEYELGVNYDSTVFIKQSIEELKTTLILAGILTSLVVYLFLGSWSATFNVILSIPTSIIASFMALSYFGFTLNTFTFLSLTLAVGLVVDDNIMILENMGRHYALTKDRISATIEGAKEISFAAFASSLALVAIVIPVGFMEGVTGKYFYQFAITLTAAIGFSFIDAVTLTPMRFSLMKLSGNRETTPVLDRLFKKLENKYKNSLNFALNWKWSVVLGSTVLFLLSLFLFNQVKKEFVPSQDQSRLMIMGMAPPGKNLDYTNEKVKKMEEILMKLPELERYFVAIGGFGGTDPNQAFSYLTLKPIELRPIDKEKNRRLSQNEITEKLRESFKSIDGIMFRIMDPSLSSLGSGRGYPIEFSLLGSDLDILLKTSNLIQEKMTASETFKDVDSNFKGLVPEFHIVPKREEALRRGVSVADISEVVQILVGGKVVGKFGQEGRRYDIRLKYEDQALKDIETLKNIKIRNNRGELIALGEVASFEFNKGLNLINRTNRERSISITANISNSSSQSESLVELKKILKENLPSGYSFSLSGNSKTYGESFNSFILVMLLGILASYMILASQFNSFLLPLIIFMALPFSVTGAFVALYLSGQSLNAFSAIGILLLLGIVKKNSIILVDYTEVLVNKGNSIRAALMEASPIRLRPIIMTSVSTVAATIPVLFSFGAGYETRAPMAYVILGGVVLSTVLTLYVVPCIYLAVVREKKV